jgi:HD superfamily phosphohydrolase
MQTQQEFRKKINRFVKSIFKHYEPRKIKQPKIIHETIQGSNIFYEHEISLMDTPLLQRLRQIHQTGLCFLTFPTALHTRFDHTLGVTTLAGKFFKILIEKESNSGKKTKIDQDPYKGDFANLRTAALLHDCGHAFLSHHSEKMYEAHNIIQEIMEIDKFSSCKPHEILSYHIVKSPFFKRWFKENILDEYKNKKLDIDLDIVANMIIGTHDDDSKFFLAEIINGPFDADKLDYIKRDGVFSGLKIVVDEERLFHALTTDNIKGKQHMLLKTHVPIEQIIFSKMMLFSSMYYHQKVMACNAMITSLIEYMCPSSIGSPCFFKGNPLTDPVDYLKFTDYDILNALSSKKSKQHPFLHKTIWNLFQRTIYIRALTISASNIENWKGSFPEYIIKLMREKNERDKLRGEIFNKIPKNIRNKYGLILPQIQLSFSVPPFFKGNDETLNSYVSISKGKYVELDNFFPVGQWVGSYINFKWKGYIFCPSHDEVRKEIHKIAKDILRKKGLTVNS